MLTALTVLTALTALTVLTARRHGGTRSGRASKALGAGRARYAGGLTGRRRVRALGLVAGILALSREERSSTPAPNAFDARPTMVEWWAGQNGLRHVSSALGIHFEFDNHGVVKTKLMVMDEIAGDIESASHIISRRGSEHDLSSQCFLEGRAGLPGRA